MLRLSFQVVLCAALFAMVADADAKGRRGSRSSSTPASSKADADKDTRSGGTTIVLRPSRSGSTSQGNGTASSLASPGGGSPASGFVPIAPREPTPEEQQAEADRVAAYHRAQADKAAAQRAASEEAEAQRLALERAEAERAAQRSAAERAQAAKDAAALAERKRQEASVAADVDRVLQRAMDDHPVLRTPEGEPLLRRIMERQKVLQARGVYPSIAMVEAVADHRDALAPRAKPQAQAAAPAPAAQVEAFGGCRWVTPSQWSCK